MSDKLFSDRLKRYRERHGLSQDEAGTQLGVSGRYVGMIERGDKVVEQSSSLAKLFALIETQEQLQMPTVKELPAEYMAANRSAEGDAELMSLAALLMHHTFRATAGDLPVVRNALERALQQRGVLPKT
jgi:transcriptional regulator with XRE-family HTH domain